MIIDEILPGLAPDKRDNLRQRVERAVILRPQNVVDYFYESPDEFVGVECIPSPIPPWPLIWAEWRFPRVMRLGADSLEFSGICGEPVGALIESEEIPIGWTMAISVFSRNGWMLTAAHELDKAGELTGDARCVLHDRLLEGVAAAGLHRDEAAKIIPLFCKPLLMAFSFANCKNVKAVATPTPPKLAKRRAERGKIAVRKTYTLEITPMTRVLEREGKVSEHGLVKALHICRGHFKNFDAKPLFGRLRGRYWWGAQVRGNKSAGTVDKDYAIKAPKGESK